MVLPDRSATTGSSFHYHRCKVLFSTTPHALSIVYRDKLQLTIQLTTSRCQGKYRLSIRVSQFAGTAEVICLRTILLPTTPLCQLSRTQSSWMPQNQPMNLGKAAPLRYLPYKQSPPFFTRTNTLVGPWLSCSSSPRQLQSPRGSSLPEKTVLCGACR